MSALNALRWRVRGQMVATGDSARRCARVDGVYSTPGVDGVYSTTAREARVDDARRRAAIGPMRRSGVFLGRQPCARRRRVGVGVCRCAALREGFLRSKRCRYAQFTLWTRATGTFFALAFL